MVVCGLQIACRASRFPCHGRKRLSHSVFFLVMSASQADVSKRVLECKVILDCRYSHCDLINVKNDWFLRGLSEAVRAGYVDQGKPASPINHLSLLPYLFDWRGRDLADDLVWSGLDMIADQLGGSGSKLFTRRGKWEHNLGRLCRSVKDVNWNLMPGDANNNDSQDIAWAGG